MFINVFIVAVYLVSVGLGPGVIVVLFFKLSVCANDLIVVLFSFSMLVIYVVWISRKLSILYNLYS